MAENELQALVRGMNHARGISQSMLNKLNALPGFDAKKVFTVGDTRLNTVYWLTGHIAWAENNLVLRATGGPNPELPWLKLFGLGKPAEEAEQNGPAWEEVLAGFARVHELVLAHLATLDVEVLGQPVPTGFVWRGESDVRMSLRHQVVHESMHTGHLGWLCKLYGVKLI
ncbi:MAG: DinB family protein [Bacteroidia bacterium]|jgi:hypothetical protein|nr:DinB family protein [Bacteroidia bacterium]